MVQIIRKIIDLASLYGRKKLLIFACVIFSITGLAMLATFSVPPLMTMVFNDMETIDVLGQQWTFKQVVVGFALCQLMLCIGMITAEKMRVAYIANFGAWLRVTMLDRVMKRPYSYFTKNNSSVIQQTVNGYAGSIGAITGQLLDLMMKCLMVSAYVAVAIWMNPILASVVTLITIIYYLLVVRLFRSVRRSVSSELKAGNDKLQSFSMQTIQGVKLLRISQKETIFVDQYQDAARVVAKNQVLPTVLSVVPRYILELLLMLSMAYYFYNSYSTGRLVDELPQISVLVFVAFKGFPLAQGIYGLYNELSTKTFILEKVSQEFFAGEMGEEEVPLQHFKSEITLRNLAFRYNADLPLIQFPDLSIKRGETLGIQGPSGAGKSTLMDLLLGLYDATEGEIELDGEVASSVTLRGLYDEIGYVGQDPFLLNMTIAENISLERKENIDQKKLEKAARLAQIGDFIEELPEGYSSIVGDRGVRLSGGQRQRIAIARALYNEPTILFFDEATSALDHVTEKRIMDTIYSLPDDMTIVMIAHRLSTLDRADKIIQIGG